MDADTRRAKRLEIKRRMRPLRTKRRRGEDLTPDEQARWDDCLRALNRLGGTPRGGWATGEDKPYDSKSGASSRGGGPTTRQGPASGVTSVVSGGLPGLGRRR